MNTTSKTRKKLADLRSVLSGKANMVIVMQDNPDPDALAAAAALRRLANHMGNLQCSFTCGGAVWRAENRAMVRYLDLNIHPIEQLDIGRFDVTAMVDTQPGQGNNSLPAGATPHVVIDHHPMRPQTRAAAFSDIRKHYGATSTILFEYLRESQLLPDAPLATALLYGIRSDTQDLGRETTHADIDAYGWLYPIANKRMLANIQRGEAPTEYFRLLNTALKQAHLCGKCIYANLGAVDNPDMIAEVADLLLRHETADWSMCWGVCGQRILYSIRTIAIQPTADAVARKIVQRIGTGGGHRTMAAGQVRVENDSGDEQKRLASLILKRYLQATGNAQAESKKLI